MVYIYNLTLFRNCTPKHEKTKSPYFCASIFYFLLTHNLILLSFLNNLTENILHQGKC